MSLCCASTIVSIFLFLLALTLLYCSCWLVTRRDSLYYGISARRLPSSDTTAQRYVLFIVSEILSHLLFTSPMWGWGTPLSPLSIYFLIFSPFHFSLSFIGFTYFLLLSISSLSTRIVPLHFQAGGHRRRPNLGLVCVLFCLCYLYSLVKVYCGALFYLV